MSRDRPVDTVILDCDSTLTAIEGIDELARRAGVFEQLSPLTTAAMAGELQLEEVYRQRLELIRPARADVAWLGTEYIRHRLADSMEIIATLVRCKRDVHIVSGGIRQAVLVLAEALGVRPANVHAVDLYFDNDGLYDGYDECSPLTRNDGKKIVCGRIIGDSHSAVLLGDGITDLEAEQDRLVVIGVGGIVSRQAVKQGASDFIAQASLRPLLERVLTHAELARLKN